MLPPMCSQPPCMNIEVRRVSQMGIGPGASSITTLVPSGATRRICPMMSFPDVISAGTVEYPFVKFGSTS